MNRMQAQVREFCEHFERPTSPAEPKFRDAEIRAALIMEEALETVIGLVGLKEAVEVLERVTRRVVQTCPLAPSLVDTIDGLCDLIYTALGAAESIGVDLEPFFDEVHRTNMAKAPNLADPRGKIVKPAGWQPPRIRELLQLAQMAWFRSDAAEAVERRSR